jgi:hypothetical protein
VRDVHLVPRYLLAGSDIFSNPSFCATPTMAALKVLPAEAQYQTLSMVKVPKYLSTTTLPLYKMIKALVFFPCKKFMVLFRADVFQPNAVGLSMSHVVPEIGGKYMGASGSGPIPLLSFLQEAKESIRTKKRVDINLI